MLLRQRGFDVIVEGVEEGPHTHVTTETGLRAFLKAPGIDRVFTSSELDHVSADDPVQRAAALSYRRDRSGDMVLVPKRFWIASSAATTHGTLHDYDQRVPLVFYGAGVRAAQFDGPATPADIAPTLGGLAGITLKGTDGQRLPVNP